MANSVIKANIGAVLNSYEGDIVTIKSPIERPFIMNMQADITPIQDLHGYTKPWAGGNGKNLLPYAETMQLWGAGSSASISNAVATIIGSSSNWNGALNTALYPISLYDGSRFVLSFDIKTNATCSVQIMIASTNSAVGTAHPVSRTKYVSWGLVTLPNTNGSWQRFSMTSRTISLSDLASGSGDTNAGYIQIYARSNTTIEITKPQLEKSDTATSFEPYSNICPISGWDEAEVTRTGANIVGSLEIGGINGNTASAVGKTYAEMKASMTTRMRVQNLVSLDTAKTYILSCDFDNYEITAQPYDANGLAVLATGDFNQWKTEAFQITSTATVAIAVRRKDNGDVSSADITACNATIANADTYTIDLNDTRYGGTLDVTSGVMSVTHGIKDDATAIRTGTGASGARYADITVTGITQNASTICSHYEQIPVSGTGVIGKFKVFNNEITIYDDRFTSVSAADAILADVQLVYELATPLTVQLTPTQIEALLGTNNIWCTTGQTKLTALEMESIS